MLGLGRGGEDGLAVALEDLQPVVDVLRMAHVRERDAGLRAQEGRADLGHQFLEGIAEVTEAGAEHPVQPGRVPGPVADLVEAGGVVEVTVLERGAVRQEHQVRCGQVTGLVAAMLQLRQGQHPPILSSTRPALSVPRRKHYRRPPERCKKPLNTNGCSDHHGRAAVFFVASLIEQERQETEPSAKSEEIDC